jgi:hypothetical protein
MTIERASIAAIGGAVLTLWFGAVIAATPMLEPTRDVCVLERGEVLDRLHQVDASIVDASGAFVRLRGDGPGFVGRLYATGAWLVLPAGRGGCLGLATR